MTPSPHVPSIQGKKSSVNWASSTTLFLSAVFWGFVFCISSLFWWSALADLFRYWNKEWKGFFLFCMHAHTYTHQTYLNDCTLTLYWISAWVLVCSCHRQKMVSALNRPPPLSLLLMPLLPPHFLQPIQTLSLTAMNSIYPKGWYPFTWKNGKIHTNSQRPFVEHVTLNVMFILTYFFFLFPSAENPKPTPYECIVSLLTISFPNSETKMRA